MAHRCNYKVYFETTSDRITATYIAEWKNRYLDVLKHTLYLNGEEKIFARDNLRWVSLGGWFVAFPNEKETMRYYGGDKVKLDEYREWGKMPTLYYEEDNETNIIDRLKENYPQYKYLIQKLSNNIKGYTTIYKYLQLAYKYPNKLSVMEWLAENRQENLITDYNLKKGFSVDVINYIKEHKDISHLYIKAIELAIKSKAEYCDCYEAVCYFLGDLKLRDYLDKQKTNVDYYKDYKKMCLKLKKNFDDPYWKYPKDIYKAHNKAMQEIKALDEAKAKERLQKIAEKIRQKIKYSKKHNLVLDNLEFYFPYELDDIVNQAETLNQCLITCDYHIKYANNEKILVFVKKNNKPYATAEITQEKEIRQFYLNEKDRDKCHPTKRLKEKLNIFLDTLPKRVLI